MLRKSRLELHIGDQASVRQLAPGDRREGAALQPVLNGSALVGVSIICNHWIHHNHLWHKSSLVLEVKHAAQSVMLIGVAAKAALRSV